jgi:RNA polymerase sigma-70 factor (ECF subfamily)
VDGFQQLYEGNYRKVLGYLKSITRNEKLAEDLTQETFYNTLAYICVRREAVICLKFLLKTAHNVYVDYLRKNKIDTESLEAYENRLQDAKCDSSNRLGLIEALDALPERYREIILLKDHYGFSYNEIADIMNCKESAVKVTLFRARQRFREVYGHGE